MVQNAGIDLSILNWLKREIDENLGRARQSLVSYTEDPSKPDNITFCAHQLHQVAGTLRMVELYGAALVAEEMERMAVGISEGSVQDSDENYTVLLRAMVQLPDYLERLQSGHRDIPMVLLPLLNDLRAGCGEQLISESYLFFPDLDASLADAGVEQVPGPETTLDDQDVRKRARVLRSTYQRHLLDWFRNRNVDEALGGLITVMDDMGRITPARDWRQMWWVTSALLEALRDAGGEASTVTKTLLGRIDQTIRRISREGTPAFAEPAPRDLMKTLLYDVGQSKTDGPRVQDVRVRFKLEELFPERAELEHARSALAGQNRELLGTVSAAIKEDLLRVKEGLDLIVHGGGGEHRDLDAMTEILRRVADTLAVLGLGIPRKIIQDQVGVLDEMALGTRDTDESTLLRVASALLYVESSLEELIETLGAKRGVESAMPTAVLTEGGSLKRSDIRRILDSLMGEAITNIQIVKHAIVEFLEDSDSANRIQTVPVVLEEVVGALRILDLSRPASLLHDIGVWVDDHIIERGVVPDAVELVHLADSIASIEYYLEGVRDNWPGREGVLEIADRALSRLSQPATVEADPEVQLGRQVPARESALLEPELISSLPSIDPDLDDEIREIFMEEADQEIEEIVRLYPDWKNDPDDYETLTVLRRSFHTLKGSGRVVGARRIGEFCWKIEQILNGVLEHALPVSVTLFRVMDQAITMLPALLNDMRGVESVGAEVDQIADAADRVTAGEGLPVADEGESEADVAPPVAAADLAQSLAVIDPALYEVFRDETNSHLGVLRTYLERCLHAGGPLVPDKEMFRTVHTLNGAAAMAQMPGIVAITEPMEAWFKRIRESKAAPTPEGLDTLQRIVESVEAIVMALSMPGSELPPTEGLVARINALAARLPEAEESAPGSVLLTEPASVPQQPAEGVPVTVPSVPLEADEELLEIFLQEGGEILDEADSIIQRWHGTPNDGSIVAELQRELHTLKGGARMAGVEAIGDISHAMESLCASIGAGKTAVSEDVIVSVERGFDALHAMLQQVEAERAVTPRPDAIAQIEALRTGQLPTEKPPSRDAPAVIDPTARPEPEIRPIDAPVPEPEASPSELEPQLRAPEHPAPPPEFSAPSDLTRVRTGLLDEMVNAAGEVSIFRSRLEQQMGTVRFNLVEFNQTVSRLSDQLRQLDKETEAQILSRFKMEAPEAGADFDPLEMDRYSHIQQLSRGLAETVSDLVSIQDILDDLTRESETLLAQQSRVSADLQQGLMRTRMTRFDTLVPRLRRIVRQTADELNKNVVLNVDGGEGELDRTVLDRVTASLEHILRNAVAHGIEPPVDRRATGKEEQGHIDMTVRREGSDVVISIQDDGAGVDMDAVRRMALQRGLIEVDTGLTDDAVLQLIIGSGFSTAPELTQIAGRGVGLDVVNSEVRQLGGSLAVRSKRGQGARFTIRLPFTVAVAPALLVEAARQIYAIPLSTVVGVVRYTVDRYSELVTEGGGTFDYGGIEFPIYDLALLLKLSKHSYYPRDEQMSLIMVRSGEERAALRVDRLLGNREVVVKSVGPLLNQVPGVFGATILGDGNVILILDIAPLAQKGAEAATDPAALIPLLPELTEDADRRVKVLVVDDSITMRKVTGRVLERNNMQVFTAKDGVDAIALMQEVVPDIMLLDIEMPRMDGYDLAVHMRSDERLRDVPIIMVTSRGGAKHRQRAKDMGIERYIGKPYQENVLLATMREVLEQHGVSA